MSVTELLAHLALIGALYLFVPVVLIEFWRRKRSLQKLLSQPGDQGQSMSQPEVSVIFAAKNEEARIGDTIECTTGQTYDRVNVVVVNDRSDDRTGAIIDEKAGQVDNLQTLHVDALPGGWLGKCHALEKGSRIASGEWLLFTDADVQFDANVVENAVHAAARTGADHLVLFPQLQWKTLPEVSLLTLFTMMLGVGFKFWKVESASLRAWVGIGAFNMIRRDLYERFAGHEALRLEIADDMKLGYLAKKHGGKSVALYSDGSVRVRWREGTLDIVRGIIRSGFAGMDFNWLRLLFAVCGLVLVFLMPLVLVFMEVAAMARVEALLAIAFMAGAMGLTARSQGFPLNSAMLYPMSAILFIYGITASAVGTVLHGGVRWRDTFYSISELRRGTVR